MFNFQSLCTKIAKSTAFQISKYSKGTTFGTAEFSKQNFKYGTEEYDRLDDYEDLDPVPQQTDRSKFKRNYNNYNNEKSDYFKYPTRNQKRHNDEYEFYPNRNDNSRRDQKRYGLPELDGEILYGNHPVSVAMDAGKRTIYKLFYRERQGAGKEMQEKILQKGNKLSIPCQKVAHYEIQELCGKMTVHQDICADVSHLKVPSVESSSLEPSKLNLFLAGLHDPMNMGAVFRSALFFGVDNVFLPRISSCKLSPIVSKASSGSLEVLNMFQVDNVAGFLNRQKKSGWTIVGTSSSSIPKDIPIIDIKAFEVDANKPLLLILGNEGTGITEDLFNMCDAVLSIGPRKELPLNLDCLNVSAATAIILHSLSKQLF